MMDEGLTEKEKKKDVGTHSGDKGGGQIISGRGAGVKY